MAEEMDGEPESNQFNPYEPGEAAVSVRSDADSESSTRMAPGEPPETPTYRRWARNLRVVFGRVRGPVLGVWASFAVGVGLLVVPVVWLLMTQYSPGSRELGLLAPVGLRLKVSMVGLTVSQYVLLGVLLFAPLRPLHRAAVEGSEGAGTFGEAVGLALDRLLAIVAAVLVICVGFAAVDAGLQATGVTSEVSALGDAGIFVEGLVWYGLYFAVMPMLYRVATTDDALVACFGDGLRLVTSHLLFLVGGCLAIALYMVSSLLVIFLILDRVGSILQIGYAEPVAGVIGGLVVLVVWWSTIVAYATLLATVEEADGGAE
jgi:hypothetical protein